MPKPVVLVVEDNTAIRRGVADALRLNGYEVRECDRGDEATGRVMETPLDLVLLDVMLPRVDGFEILKQLRQARPRIGVIMLTARGAEDDRVRGLSLGADDYVIKPFSARELLARVEAVLRRLAERPLDIGKLELDDRTVDFARREVVLRGGEIRQLSERETELLRFLTLHRGRAVHRKELLRKVWGYHSEGIETRTVDMQMARLREKLEEIPSQPKVVITVRSTGYMLARGMSTHDDSPAEDSP